MKKFLSLLLAVVMTLSLVTISAGATEYKDLTDKDELGPQYQEAVAVLNKIGVITGYDDGSFRPDVKLTRGAAAKIIVSLLIGPEAASNLPNNYAPYPDVPSNHTFAGVISFCKTKGIISGYGDGTFKPANDLTGYAFAKMLLGALGYDSATERFTGTGWTQNVLSIGQYASLFDRLDFKGSEAVSRKDAALLALNTLKATVVEYNNPLNISVTGDNTNVVVSGGQVRSYKTSNQEYALNILNHGKPAAEDGWNTVEFAEDHFVDLRLTHDKYNPIDDDFGRPSAEWTYKKLSIGTFPLEADYEYTTQVIHNVDTVTDGAKTRALGLSGYSVTKINANNVVTDRANLWINGVLQNGNNGTAPELTSVADIANFTDNGTLVQVYVDNNGADFITDVVVVRTQLMEVRKVGSDYVSLDIYDDKSDADGKVLYGYNYIPIDEKVNNVEAEDDYYDFLSGMKAGDLVAVVPVAVDHDSRSYDVAEAYTPETVSGALTDAETYGNVGTDPSAINITVGGTKYNIALWNKDMYDIDSDAVKVTRKDVTLHLDKYGNALLAEDIGSTSNWMVIGNYRQGLVNGIVVTYANGWDIKGNEVSLNIGYQHDTTGDNRAEEKFPVGSLVYYTNDTNSNTAEWRLLKNGIWNVSDVATDGVTKYTINSSSSRLLLKDNVDHKVNVPDAYKMPFYVNNVPFIYITIDDSGEVDSIEIKKNPQNVTNDEILGNAAFGDVKNAEAAVTLDKKTLEMKDPDSAGIEAVVIKSESSAVSINNLLYISNYSGTVHKDENGNMVQGYEVAMLGEGGKLIATDKVIYSDRTNLAIGTFARYTPAVREGYEDFYTLRPFYANSAKDTAGDSVAILRTYIAKYGAADAFVGANSRMVYLDPNYATTTRATGYCIETFQPKADTNLVNELEANTNDAVDHLVNVRRAEWLDLTSYKQDIESPSELKDAYSDVKDPHTSKTHHRDIMVTLLFNDNPESDEFRQVYMVVVNSISTGDIANTKKTTGTTPETPTGDIKVVEFGGTATGGKVTTNGDGSVNVGDVTLTVPDWVHTEATSAASFKATTSVKWNLVKADGTKWFGADKIAKIGDFNTGKTTVALTLMDSADNDPLDADEKASVAKALSEGYQYSLTKVDWKYAKVEYTVNGKAGAFTAKTDKAEVGANTNITFTVATTNAQGGTYSITDIETPVTGTITTMSAAQSGGSLDNVKAIYGKTVKVAIKSNETLPLVFKIENTTDTLNDGVEVSEWIDGSTEDGELSFATGGSDSASYTLAAGATSAEARLTVTLDAINDPSVVSYKVEVDLPGGKQSVTLKASDEKLLIFNISEDFTLTKDAITVTANKRSTTIVPDGANKPAKLSDAQNDIVTITLTGSAVGITEDDVVATSLDGTTTIPVLRAVPSGNTLKIYFTKDATTTGVQIAVRDSNSVEPAALTDAEAGIARYELTAADLPAWNANDTVFVIIFGSENTLISATTLEWADAKEVLLDGTEETPPVVEKDDATIVGEVKTAINTKVTPGTLSNDPEVTEQTITARIEALYSDVDKQDCTVTVSNTSVTAAQNGTAQATSGTNGSYSATITITKGEEEQTISIADAEITAVAYVDPSAGQ